MYNLLGFALAFFLIQTALKILGVGSEFYFDEVALLIVFGGTFSAMIISFPSKFLMRFIQAPWKIFRSKRNFQKYTIEELIQTAMKGDTQRVYLQSLLRNNKIDSFFKEGIELYLLDLDREEFKDILTERIYRSRQRDEEWVSLFRRLSKYPPAFGLVGTVLGLISLMRSVGEGANASQIGLSMAIALVATLYGLAFSNFVLAPIAENFQKTAEDQKVYRELMLEGLLYLFDRKSALSVQEMLNSYLEPNQRIDLLGLNERVSA